MESGKPLAEGVHHVGYRRWFLRRVGGGMLLAGLGSQCVSDLGLKLEGVAHAADEETHRLTFGQLEPLVQLMQDTEPDALTKLLRTRYAKAPT